MNQQTTDTILMIRPVNFRLNEETSVNNYYQKAIEGLTPEEIHKRSRSEFDAFVKKLRAQGIRVIVVEDTIQPETPDSVFPNNWISFHQNGGVALYPMFAANRRQERRTDILDRLKQEYNLQIETVTDLTNWENNGIYLEGTGSMVLDREARIAYAAVSERTNVKPLDEFCQLFDYSPVTFTAFQTVDGHRMPIYHTNVMMCVADQFVVICADSIDNLEERKKVINRIEQSGKEVIYINEDQKNRFAGNMLQVHKLGDMSKKYLVMSEAAYTSLKPAQIKTLEKYGPVISSSLDTIEALGGGSARCMMAEVFLPENGA